MKKALIVLFFLVGAFSIASKASAANLYIDNNRTAVGCAGNTESCTNGGARTDFWFQELNILPQSGDEEIPLHSMKLYGCHENNTADGDLNYAIIATQDQLNKIKATPTITEVSNRASSTAALGGDGITTVCNGTNNFDETTMVFSSVYTVSSTTPIAAIAWWSTYGGAAPVNELTWKTVDDYYPYGNTFSFLYSGFLKGTQLTNDKDYAFRLLRDDTVLTIQTPVENQQVTLPLYIGGTCTDTVNFNLYNGITTSSSTESFFFLNNACTSNTWSRTISNLSPGFWHISASTSLQLAEREFSYAIDPDEIIFTTTTNPFASSSSPFINAITAACGDSQFTILCNAARNISSVRPFGYFPQIVGAVWSSMDNATRTDWISPIPVTSTTGFVFPIPGIRGDILDSIPQSFRDTMRPVTTIGIYIFLLAFIWSLRKKIL